jgi:hypothetical protein
VEEMYEGYRKAIDNFTRPCKQITKKIESLTIEKLRFDGIEEKMIKMEQMYQR